MKLFFTEGIQEVEIMQNEKGQNTHSKRERVKIPLFPYNVDKKSVNDLGLTVGSQQGGAVHSAQKIRSHCLEMQYKCEIVGGVLWIAN